MLRFASPGHPIPISVELIISSSWWRCFMSSSSSSALLEWVLDGREWMLPSPAVPIHHVSLLSKTPTPTPTPRDMCSFFYSNAPRPALGGAQPTKQKQKKKKKKTGPSFYVVRDDLLHPLVNGNKARKLDALLPLLRRHSATDVVTCGGCQSAHAAAVEWGIRSHLLLRGEPLEVPTGYNLLSLIYGDVTYVPRGQYAQREAMLRSHADAVAGDGGSVMWADDLLRSTAAPLVSEASVPPGRETAQVPRRVVIINEGAGSVVGLLGVIRFVKYLSQLFGTEEQIKIILDAGTGTTAIGLALGVKCLRLPWEVTGVMLSDTIGRYKEREKYLLSNFDRIHPFKCPEASRGGADEGVVKWIERLCPRKAADKNRLGHSYSNHTSVWPSLLFAILKRNPQFGKVLEGEIKLCRHIAQQTGILVDPVYTLAAWEQAVLCSLAEAEKDAKVVMLHTGGTLGMFGLAQRYTSHFAAAGHTMKHPL